MKREMVLINEELCDGCGNCIPNCHEGALQLIDGKARLVSDLMCDGLGACIGHCPQGAISIESREAEAYDEQAVISQMVSKGKNTVIAHLKHLVEHNENEYVKEGVAWLKANTGKFDFDHNDVIDEVHNSNIKQQQMKITTMVKEDSNSCGCAGSAARELTPINQTEATNVSHFSHLAQWPVQFHLINPSAKYFQGADILLASDCSAYTAGDFHGRFLKGKTLIIACPKLDSGLDSYLQKLVHLIDQAHINTIQVILMEVPCCGGLLRLVEQALKKASRKVPVKATVLSIEGKVINDEWL